MRSFLSAILPVYMIPDEFLRLESLPLMPSGKIDLRALASIQPADGPGGLYVAPRNSREQALASIAGEVLQIQRISVSASLFSLGLNSIKAVRIATRVRETLDAAFELSWLFLYPTVEELATLTGRDVAIPLLPIGRVEERRDYRLSAAQLRIWLASRLPEVSVGYNLSKAYVLRGDRKSVV